MFACYKISTMKINEPNNATKNESVSLLSMENQSLYTEYNKEVK